MNSGMRKILNNEKQNGDVEIQMCSFNLQFVFTFKRF